MKWALICYLNVEMDAFCGGVSKLTRTKICRDMACHVRLTISMSA